MFSIFKIMLLLYDPCITWICSILGAASQFILIVPQNRKPHCNRLDWGLLNYKNSITDCSPRKFEEYLRGLL